jgi:hypothetical protein
LPVSLASHALVVAAIGVVIFIFIADGEWWWWWQGRH